MEKNKNVSHVIKSIFFSYKNGREAQFGSQSITTSLLEKFHLKNLETKTNFDSGPDLGVHFANSVPDPY